MNSLGNIEATPVASLAIPCFISGDILYVTGTARNFFGKRAQKLMHRVNVLTTITITGYVFVRDAIPIRQREGTSVVQSPYNPPIRLLTEEKPGQTHYKDVSVDISRVVFQTEDIATFTFKTSEEILIRPGEWAMLDFSSFVGRPAYPQTTVISDDIAREINDDRIRTWTVSSYHPAASRTFEITMKRKADGVVTPYLFSFAHRLAGGKLGTVIPMGGELAGGVRLVSTGGEFTLPEVTKKMLWIAGGIGITPFISLLQAVQQGNATYDIEFLIATRLPNVHLCLINSTLSRDPARLNHLRITLHVYSTIPPVVQFPPGVDVLHHMGRFERASLGLTVPDVKERAVLICAPSTLSDVFVDGLIEGGAEMESVKRESFLW
jgi:ferredoxin-NADP reductase